MLSSNHLSSFIICILAGLSAGSSSGNAFGQQQPAQPETIQDSEVQEFRIPFPGDATSARSIDLDERIAEARKVVNLAQQKYDADRRLYKRGTLAKQGVEQSLFELQVAKLRLQAFQNASLDVSEDSKVQAHNKINIALAEVRVKFARSTYETVKRLRKKGSQTELEVKRKKFAYDISQLDLKRAKLTGENLEEADRQRQLADLRVEESQLRHDAAKSDYETLARLYQRGGLSKQRKQYAAYVAKSAHLDLLEAKVAASSLLETDKEFKQLDINLARAKAKTKYLKSVYETHKKLFERGSISRQEVLKSLEEVKKSELELKAATDAAKSDIET